MGTRSTAAAAASFRPVATINIGPCIRSSRFASVVVDTVKVAGEWRRITRTTKRYICPNGNAGQLVAGKRPLPNSDYAVADGNAGQLITGKRTVPNGDDAVGYGNAGQLVAGKSTKKGDTAGYSDKTYFIKIFWYSNHSKWCYFRAFIKYGNAL